MKHSGNYAQMELIGFDSTSKLSHISSTAKLNYNGHHCVSSRDFQDYKM